MNKEFVYTHRTRKDEGALPLGTTIISKISYIAVGDFGESF